MLIVGAGHVLLPTRLLAEEDIKYVPQFLRLGTSKSEANM